jgi:hypothetical protein
MTRPKKDADAARFEIGDKVRAKYGVSVPDFEDIPLGGWAGTIQNIEQSEFRIDYEVEWDRRTIDAMHPVYKKRCERDDLDVKTMWLAEEDIEADDGIPVPIEQPTDIKTPQLSEKDQDDRVRKALGLTHDDPLPEISPDRLLTYHRYLTAKLKFPFTAFCGEEEIGPFSRKRATITVTGLLDPVREEHDLEDGLFCTCRGPDDERVIPLADIEVGKKNPNFKLITDYAYWFHNWPCQDESHNDLEGELLRIESQVRSPGLPVFTKVVLVCGVGGVILGATIGAALRTVHGAGTAAMIGGIPLGMIGAFLLGRYGMIAGAVNRVRFGALQGAALGSLGGALVGVVAGLTVVSLPWSLLGLIAGLFLGPYVLPKKQRRRVSFRVASFGACVGILASAFRHDQARATAGAITGAVIGLLAATGLLLLLVGVVYLTPGREREYDKTDEEDDEFEDFEEEDEDHDGDLRLRRF